MSDRVDIAEPVGEIIRRLELDPDDVAEILITATRGVRVILYRRRDGNKFLEDDEPALTGAWWFHAKVREGNP